MKLILHIGTEKTGTTALQTWLHENTEQLRAQGVWYAQSLGLPNNRALSVISRRGHEREDGFRDFGLETPADHAAFRACTIAALERDVAAARRAGAHTFMISSEHCHSRLRKQAQVDRLAALIRPMFDSVEVYCFLRPQVELALSRATTGSRVGLHVSPKLLRGVRPENLFYDYSRLLDRWARAFGKAQVHPVPMRRNPRPIAYFMNRLRLDPARTYTADRRINGALDYRVIALMNRIVEPGSRRGASKVGHMHRRMFLERLPCDEPLTLSREEARAVQDRFADSNARLAAAWPQVTLEDLTPDFDAYPEQGTFDLLDTADIGGVLQDVIGRFNSELAMARGRIGLMESREAEAAGNLSRAIALMDPAIAHLAEARQVPAMADWATEQHGNYIARRAALVAALADRSSARNLARRRAMRAAQAGRRRLSGALRPGRMLAMLRGWSPGRS